MTRQEVRESQLRVLDELDNFCRLNNINYMLAYGTLIGAVRHKGFIPWDDDVDVMMTRSEYERFKKLYSESNMFGFKTTENDKTYNLSFGRLYDKSTVNLVYNGNKCYYGVFVDVYPMDDAPDSEEEFRQQVEDLKAITKWRNLLCNTIAVMYKYRLSFIADILYTILPSVMRSREKVVLRYNSDTKRYCSCIASSGSVRHLKSNIEQTTKLEFEGKEYMVPKGYDAFLKEYYGDYMKLPPEEQRIPYHLGNYYWKTDD